jgi:hypothetical protein
MTLKNFAVIMFVVLTVSLFAADSSANAYTVVQKDGFTLSWKINGDLLDVKISAPVTGWVAIGIDPGNGMKDADFIIGYVDAGKAMASDEYGTGAISHKPDTSLGGKDNITNLSGTEKDNTTELSFSIPLDSGDKYDKKITKGTHKIILGCSNSDNFTSKHVKFSKLDIEIK